jgi:Na+/glutamate symporter
VKAANAFALRRPSYFLPIPYRAGVDVTGAADAVADSAGAAGAASAGAAGAACAVSVGTAFGCFPGLVHETVLCDRRNRGNTDQQQRYTRTGFHGAPHLCTPRYLMEKSCHEFCDSAITFVFLLQCS